MGDYIKQVHGGRPKRSPVGVRELKTHAARIVREVREEYASYVITHRGTAVGVILPLQNGAEPPEADASRQSPWTEFLAAGRRVESGFRSGVSAVRTLSESRR
jgi:prevent-host-death family protein